jgi:hypothetical protein
MTKQYILTENLEFPMENGGGVASRVRKAGAACLAKRKRTTMRTVTITVLTLAFLGWSGKVKGADGATLAASINIYGAGGGSSGVLTAVWNAGTNTVTVTNTGDAVTGANATLMLNIDAGVTVLWQAKLTGNLTSPNVLVNISGNGIFEVVNGGKIEDTGTGGAIINTSTGRVNIFGGIVKTRVGISIENESTGVITISGTALITSGNYNTISGTISMRSLDTSTAPRLIIMGGTIENTATQSTARTIYNNSRGTINILGGTISATAAGRAIHNQFSGIVNVFGGLIKAANGDAIYIHSANSGLVVNGTAVVFAYGNNIGDVITNNSGSTNIDDDAVIIAWNESAGTTQYIQGNNNDLFWTPSTATVSWDLVQSNSGISYNKNNNTGFIPTANVTVKQTTNDATLSSLTVSESTLTPAFSSSTFNYTVNVGNNITSITILATSNDPNATITGTGTKQLNIGANPFTITVTARDGITKFEYKVTVTRSDVSIIETECNVPLQVYPNPTTSQLRIANYKLRNNTIIEIFDMVGRNVGTYCIHLENTEIIVDLSHLSAGMYFLKVDGKTVKFVKE